ncbi:MAG: ArsA-related P-loop ATPase [Gemmobacter sp.]
MAQEEALFNDSQKFVFLSGKGGVGKTSLACAMAVCLADAGRRVLLVSTDPASNVGQVFGVEIGNRITAIAAVPGVTTLEIDPGGGRRRVSRADRDADARGAARNGAQGDRGARSGARTTEIAAFDEFTALLTGTAVTGAHDLIIFDTAPSGHTIRMRELPGARSGLPET